MLDLTFHFLIKIPFNFNDYSGLLNTFCSPLLGQIEPYPLLVSTNWDIFAKQNLFPAQPIFFFLMFLPALRKKTIIDCFVKNIDRFLLQLTCQFKQQFCARYFPSNESAAQMYGLCRFTMSSDLTSLSTFLYDVLKLALGNIWLIIFFPFFLYYIRVFAIPITLNY